MTTIKGSSQFLANLRKFTSKKISELESAMEQSGVILKNEAVQNTPWDTGLLREQHYEVTERQGKQVLLEIGVDLYYAPFVHENLENFHPVGEAKWMENAIKNNLGRIEKLIIDRLKV